MERFVNSERDLARAKSARYYAESKLRKPWLIKSPGFKAHLNALKKAKNHGYATALTTDEMLKIREMYIKRHHYNKLVHGTAIDFIRREKRAFQIDHTVPKSRGGKHHPNNLEIVPRWWNYEKSNHNFCRWNQLID